MQKVKFSREMFKYYLARSDVIFIDLAKSIKISPKRHILAISCLDLHWSKKKKCSLRTLLLLF